MGKSKQRNTLRLDTTGFEKYITKLESLGGNVEQAVNEALSKSAEQISKDTHLAMQPQYLPAQGKYSTGTTEASIIDDATVRWQGLTAWIPVGFDFAKKGAGGYLITGTPKMKPNPQLNAMYKQKKYMKQIQDEMEGIILLYITDKMGKK